MNPFAVLGLAPNATTAEIKRAYLRLARERHPDHDLTPGAHERFIELQSAYDALKERRNSAAAAEGLHFRAEGVFFNFGGGGGGYSRQLRRYVDLTLEELHSGCEKFVELRPGKPPLKINIHPGITQNKVLRFADNIEVCLRDIRHPVYGLRDEQNRLHHTVQLSLTEALCGWERALPRLNGGTLLLSNDDSITAPESERMIAGAGVAGAPLVIKFQVAFPRELSAAQKQQIKQILN
jgi:DnaJ-class molecular chaperone